MDVIPVQSSSLADVAYDETNQILYVTFVKGGRYRYFNVPESIFSTLIGGGSVGQFFAANVQYVFSYERC